jgi:hypothetical protein
MTTTTKDQPRLVNIDRLLAIIFDADSCPTKRFMLQQKALGNIPFYKIGRRVFYNPQEVMDALTSSPNPSDKGQIEGGAG